MYYTTTIIVYLNVAKICITYLLHLFETSDFVAHLLHLF